MNEMNDWPSLDSNPNLSFTRQNVLPAEIFGPPHHFPIKMILIKKMQGKKDEEKKGSKFIRPEHNNI